MPAKPVTHTAAMYSHSRQVQSRQRLSAAGHIICDI